MHAGTISALDALKQFGLIDADDGRILPFNHDAFEQSLPEVLRVGVRVEFVDVIVDEEPRAVTVRLRAQG